MKQVFEGVKIADFSWVAVGPQISRELAEHGAMVVRVECHKNPDPIRTMAPFRDNITTVDRSAFGAAYNTGKYGISLDLNKPKAQDIAKRLVKWADIVQESYTPGTMAKWGLDYENCRKINPEIIYLSTCQHGQYGPFSKLPGFGAFSSIMGGYSSITGWPDRDPAVLWNNFTDFIAPEYAVMALIGALAYRERTGRGMYIEESQLEAALSFLGPAILDYTANGRVAKRRGNRDIYMVPHGVYRCRGDDYWAAIAVSSEEEWQSFCKVLGDPQWTNDPKFSSFASRKENEDELDVLVAAWTVNYTAQRVMTTMQAKGVPAGVVEKAQEVLDDPQLRHREHFRFLEHKTIGKMPLHSPAYKLSKTPCHMWKAPPCLGEDNLFVYKEVLGLSEDAISDLIVEGVITTEADVPEFLKGKD